MNYESSYVLVSTKHMPENKVNTLPLPSHEDNTLPNQFLGVHIFRSTLVTRSSPAPVFDCLQYAKMEGEGLVNLTKSSAACSPWYPHSQAFPTVSV